MYIDVIMFHFLTFPKKFDNESLVISLVLRVSLIPFCIANGNFRIRKKGCFGYCSGCNLIQ